MPLVMSVVSTVSLGRWCLVMISFWYLSRGSWAWSCSWQWRSRSSKMISHASLDKVITLPSTGSGVVWWTCPVCLSVREYISETMLVLGHIGVPYKKMDEPIELSISSVADKSNDECCCPWVLLVLQKWSCIHHRIKVTTPPSVGERRVVISVSCLSVCLPASVSLKPSVWSSRGVCRRFTVTLTG